MSLRRTWGLEAGLPVRKTKHVVCNNKDWKKYIGDVILLCLEARIEVPPPASGEKISISCRWYLADPRADCVNYHDLLADALKEALGVDDVHFLVRDIWCELDVADPRVEVSIATERAPTSRTP